jgi:hypothetical protein
MVVQLGQDRHPLGGVVWDGLLVPYLSQGTSAASPTPDDPAQIAVRGLHELVPFA